MVGRDYQYNDAGSERHGREERINLDPKTTLKRALPLHFQMTNKQKNETKVSLIFISYWIHQQANFENKMSSQLYQEILISMRPHFVEGVSVRFSQRKKLHFQSILTNSTGQVIKNYEYIPEELP